MPWMRTMSEPPEAEETNMKTGLRGGFPIKINGQALGSQDNLQEFGTSTDIFGPRIRSRQSSVTPQDQDNEILQGRRRSLRGTTPVKIAGMEFTTNSAKEDTLFSTPFGTTQAPGQMKKMGIMGKRTLPQHQNNNSISIQNKSSSLLNLSLLHDSPSDKNIQATFNISQPEEKIAEQQVLNQFEFKRDNQCYQASSSELNQEKEEHFQKRITIRATHSESREKEGSEISNVQNSSFLNGTIGECFDKNSTNVSENFITNTSTVIQEVKETSFSETSTFETVSQENETINAQNQASGIENHYVPKNYNLDLNSLDSTSRQDTNETSPPSFMLQRPKAFQKQNNTKLSNGYQRLSSTHKDHNIYSSNGTLHESSNSLSNKNEYSYNDESVFEEKKREFTPLDLPVLSKVPEYNMEKKEMNLDVHDRIQQDFQEVEFLTSKEERVQEYSSMCSVEMKSCENTVIQSMICQREEHQNEVENGLKESINNKDHDDFIRKCTPEMEQAECKEVESEAFTDNLELDMEEVKEYNVQAKIILNSSSNCTNTDSHVLLRESNLKSNDTGCQFESNTFSNELYDLGILHTSDKNVDSTEKSVTFTEDNLIRELNEKFHKEFETRDEPTKINIEEDKRDSIAEHHQDVINKCIQTSDKNVDSTEKSDTFKEDNLIRELNEKFHKEYETRDEPANIEIEENKGDSIAEHHKDVINKCIQELEQSEAYQLDEEIKTDESCEESHFTTEKIIDNTDLEHLYVMNKKNAERRESFSSQNIESNNLTELGDSLGTANNLNLYKKIEDTNQIGLKEDTNTGMKKLSSLIAENKMFTESESSITTCNSSVLSTESEKESDTETEIIDTSKCFDKDRTSASDSNTFFLTESNSENDSSYSWQFKLDLPKIAEKRKRNRTIDYHNLPSLFWEGAVKDYHEKTFPDSESGQNDNKTDVKQEDKNGLDIAKDGLSIILERLKGIESKLDSLKETENTITSRHDARRSSLPGRFSTLSNLPSTILPLEDDNAPTPTEEIATIDENNIVNEESDANLNDSCSNCSTPTFMEIKQKPRVNGYESDSTVYQESDCEIIIDEKSENEEAREETWTYKPFNLNISEISDLESEEEDPEERSRRIESLAAMMTLNTNSQMEKRREDLNMEIDTLSERSEEEGDREEQKPKQRSRKPSGRKRSMSRDRNVAKLRYCWRCHHAGHENWECREDVQPGGWCPRCLETSHWIDACWVEAAHVLCTICSIPGHLPCIHQATDFRQRKLVIDTFGWLPFKDWFQDLTFRSWWNCSGYTGVPLYKIMQRNPTQDLDLGFDDS